jgi:hypothetical protein
MNDWNEWKRQKRHANTNMARLRTTRIMMAVVRTSLPVWDYAWFLFRRGYTYARIVEATALTAHGLAVGLVMVIT